MGFDGVGADAEDFDVGVLETRELVADAAAFLGSAGGVIFRVEPHQHPRAPAIGQVTRSAILVGKSDLWSGVTRVQTHESLLLVVVRNLSS